MTEVIDVSGMKVEVMKDLSKNHTDTFVFLDPPYCPTAKTKTGKISPYRLYNATDFLPVDFLRLKSRCDELTASNIPFILCNSDCEFIRVLFQDYILIEVNEARVMQSGKGKGSRPAAKCLFITNFKQKKYFMKGADTMNKLMEDKKEK